MVETVKRVVVSGAAGVLGEAVAQAFATAGAQVALIDRAADSNGLAKRLGAPHFFMEDVDLTDPAPTQHALNEVIRRLGAIDVLVNVAGGFRWETLADGKLETWDFLYAINLKTAVSATKAAL